MPARRRDIADDNVLPRNILIIGILDFAVFIFVIHVLLRLIVDILVRLRRARR
jgi:hypothetical protein